MSTIGDRIKQKRKELGLTQLELGEKLNVTDRAVSKWEQNEGNPDISIVPEIAKALGVTLDYLLLGKETSKFTLDDLDGHKRALYLIEKDDAVNFEKYSYAKSELLFCGDAIREMHLPKENAEIKNRLIECESYKIFGLLADKLIEDLKSKKYDYSFMYYSASAACLVYDYLDDFVKLCALANKVELLDLMKFKSFAISSKKNERYYKANRFEDFYSIRQETLDFIFADKRVPKEMVEYVSNYEPFVGGEIRYSYGPTYDMDSSKAIRMTDNVILSLCKAKRNKELDRMIDDMKKEAKSSHDNALSKSLDYGWRSSYNFGPYGYMFYTNGNGSVQSTSCQGRIVIINKAIEFVLKQKDKQLALKLSKYNSFVQELLGELTMYQDVPSIFVLSEKDIDSRIKTINREELVESIKNDTSISDYDRRRKLYDLNALSFEDAVRADDYDLFAQFPFNEIHGLTISSIARCCNDIRFYIYAINMGAEQERLDDALEVVLERKSDRYDIIDVLLSAGAKVKDNPSMTAILKQNVLILNKQKEINPSEIQIKSDETEKGLLQHVKDKDYEYVVVNLTIQLEKKLKAKYGNSIQLLDMIDSAFNDSLISDLERKMLHNLRKARNMIMHEGDEKGYYTPEVLKEWIRIVYSIK